MELVKIENGQIVVAQEIINAIVQFEKQALEMKLKQDELKQKLLEAMEENGITNWETPNGEIKVSYRKPSTRTTLDSTKLKNELPDIYEEYSKTSEVKSSIVMKVE
ncbi:MAG TPA: hypothetical protein GX708_09800 [Gallicola sp.]|nr:hypothetical protein [Gallicola sp.]